MTSIKRIAQWNFERVHRSHEVGHTTPTNLTRRNLGIWSRAQDFWKKMVGVDNDPRVEREWQDIAMALLALNHRRLRLKDPGQHPNKLIEPAYQGLEKTFLDLNNQGLRYELHDALAPILLEVLAAFQNVDGRLGSPDSIDVGSPHHQIILDEYADTLRQLSDTTGTSSEKHASPNRPSRSAFLHRKSGALCLLLDHYRWLGSGPLEPPPSSAFDLTQSEPPQLMDDDKDSFGYNALADDPDTRDDMRHFQAINLVRSAMLRKDLGFSVIALSSTLPGAGRGVFVDGTALAGSLVAFMPGEVWPKEHLIKLSPAQRVHFSDDGNDQLSLRSDEALIDSRRSPYTVLTDEGSNPWALGHIVNHPPSGAMPNCRVVLINFTEQMSLDRSGLMRYVPNTYARQPMILGARSFDRERVVMLGLGLQAVRDVSREELFYDYRLSLSKDGHPPWYHTIDPEEAAERYKQEQTEPAS